MLVSGAAELKLDVGYVDSTDINQAVKDTAKFPNSDDTIIVRRIGRTLILLVPELLHNDR
jgi:hypothetical protein